MRTYSAPAFIRFLLSRLKEPCENCKEMQRALTQVARENRSLEKRCVSLAAAEARAYANAIEQAAGVADAVLNDADEKCGLVASNIAFENGRKKAATAIANEVRQLRPIPNQVEAERKRITDLIRAARRQYTVETEGAYPLLVAVLNDLLAAIDAKEDA